MRRLAQFAIGCFTYFAFASSASPQDLRPLNQTLNAETESSYAIVRCAAFYTSMVEWAGQKVGQETYDQIRLNVNNLLLIGTLVRSESSSDTIEHLSQIVMTDARKIADLYLENYRINYATTGSAWDGNLLWTEDINFCESVAQAAAGAANGLEGSEQ